MPLRCTCGAVLPEDARFCHKCGKPQYEEDVARLSAPEPPVVTPAGAASAPGLHPAAPIGFGNRRAVRITLSVAAFSLLALVIFATVAPALIFLIMFAAGFASVRVYLSRTAENLTASAGAALGAMTWLWLYLVAGIEAAFNLFTVQGREVFKTAIALKRPEVAQLIDDPQKFALFVVAVMIILLVIGTAPAAFGGIVAVRLQPRGGSSH